MEPHINYIDKKNAKKLKACIKRYHSQIAKDERIDQEYFHGNTQWEFFSQYYKDNAEDDCRAISDWILNNFSEVKRTISSGEIHDFLQYSVFYRLTFQPRDVNLKTALTDDTEMEHLIAFFDQAVAGMVNHYKSHRSLAVIEVVNLKIEDTNIDWAFCNVNFISSKGKPAKAYFKWVSDSAKVSDASLCGEFESWALVKYEGSSSHRAFVNSLDYFNKTFGMLRVLASEILNRQYWTSKYGLEIPSKQPAFISSSDPPMWSGSNPKIDNDFYAALKENSIYLPVVLNENNIKAIEGSEFMEHIKIMLQRSFNDDSFQIDDKIFDAISWFSKAQKNTNPLHKIVAHITALETLLSNSRLEDGVSDGSISELISDRGAILLHDTYEKRLEAKKMFKKIYGLRSAIVHGSKRQVAKNEQDETKTIFEIESTVAKIILKTVETVGKNGMESIPELNSFIQKVLLS